MKKTFVIGVVLLLASGFVGAATVEETVKPRVEGFEYGRVKLLPGLFKTRFDINREYLMSLSNDSLLYPYYKEAVIRVQRGSKPLGGWEAMSVDIRGHFLGHYLSACARIYATAGDTEIKAKADRIVAELAKVQEANGNGYVGPISEKVFTALETGRESEVWAPYYVIHKVLMGLYEMYRYAGNEQALEIAKGMADYVKARTDKLSDTVMARTLEVEHGGMAEVLYDLYAVTGEAKYQELAKRFEHVRFLDPLAAGQDNLSNMHANTQIPKIYGAARAYELTGDKRYRDISVNFWNIVNETRTYATGGSSDREYWRLPNQLSDTLGEANQETCTAHNMMWETRYLLRWTGEAKYADYYERNLYNGIISIQSPADGQFCYFTPMKSGSSKRFGTPTNSFWCCYGTGVQAFADLASSIYFHDAENVYVNLFAPSEASWSRPEGTVRITQETSYPEVSATRLTVRASEPAEFGLKIRVPWWVKKGVEVKVNGKKVEVTAEPSTFLTLDRKWSDQDVVEVSMPMSLYAAPINDNPNRVAVMYGPLVMAGLVFEDVTFRGDKNDLESWIKPAVADGRVPSLRIKNVGDVLPDYISHPSFEAGLPRDHVALTFQAVAPNLPVKLIPLYEVGTKPYCIYFRVTN